MKSILNIVLASATPEWCLNLGHIMPAITMAHMIKEDCIKTKIVFIMTSKDEKYEFIKKDPHIDEIYYYDIDGLNRKKLISNIKNIPI